MTEIQIRKVILNQIQSCTVLSTTVPFAIKSYQWPFSRLSLSERRVYFNDVPKSTFITRIAVLLVKKKKFIVTTVRNRYRGCTGCLND